MSLDNHESNNYNIENVMEETKNRFSHYINYNSLDLHIKKIIAGITGGIMYSNSFDVTINIDLKNEKFIQKYNFDEKKIKLFKQYLFGTIILDNKEAMINTVSVGLFNTKDTNFTDEEREAITDILGNKGFGALLVLIFIYFCYSFNKINPDYKIDQIVLDDSSKFPGWYKNLFFEYPDQDESAVFELTPENFEKLQNSIYKYSNKRLASDLTFVNKRTYDTSNLDLLSNVATNAKSKKRKVGGKIKKKRTSKKIKRKKMSKKIKRNSLHK